jgi:hypothetical protein
MISVDDYFIGPSMSGTRVVKVTKRIEETGKPTMISYVESSGIVVSTEDTEFIEKYPSKLVPTPATV